MIAAVLIEHVAGAMGNIALVALIMALCDVRYSAFQYALMSSIALLPRYGLGYPAGWVADQGGWAVYFVVSFVLAMPGSHHRVAHPGPDQRAGSAAAHERVAPDRCRAGHLPAG